MVAGVHASEAQSHREEPADESRLPVKTREPEELTKVDGVRPPTPPPPPQREPELLQEAIGDSEPPLNLSPPPVARFDVPRSFPRSDATGRGKPAKNRGGRRK